MKHFACDFSYRIDFAVDRDHISLMQGSDASPIRLFAIIPLRMTSEIRAPIPVCVEGIIRVCNLD